MSSNKQPGLPTEVSYNEAVEASKKYFDGDDLAATVWVRSEERRVGKECTG